MEIKVFSTACGYKGNYSTSVNILPWLSKNITSIVKVNVPSMMYILSSRGCSAVVTICNDKL